MSACGPAPSASGRRPKPAGIPPGFSASSIIARPLIEKVRRTYLLPDGCRLEVNHVDAGQPGAFWYAEIEYPTVDEAEAWSPAALGLGDYLADEVTDQPGQSMGAYWERTRL